MTQKRYTEIPKRQKCINKEEPYIGGAKDILDDELNKPQSQINDETNQRVSTLEESVAPGGSIDERITVEKNRAEQAEGVLDGKVAAEKQRAEGVEGGLNTRLQTVEELATISVGGGDIGIGTAADFESDDPSDLAKVPTVGAMLGGANDGVYDISARHSGTKYADLAAALGTNGANIPQSLRKGGMSVKFVQSSDNKYVQYRLMSDTFNSTSANWQGIDDDPTIRSENLVKSCGVAKKMLESSFYPTFDNVAEASEYASISSDGTLTINDEKWGIKCKIGHRYLLYAKCLINLYTVLTIYNSTGTSFAYRTGSTYKAEGGILIYDVTVPDYAREAINLQRPGVNPPYTYYKVILIDVTGFSDEFVERFKNESLIKDDMFGSSTIEFDFFSKSVNKLLYGIFNNISVCCLGDSMSQGGTEDGNYPNGFRYMYPSIDKLGISVSGSAVGGSKVSGSSGFNSDTRINALRADAKCIIIFGGTNDAANNVSLGEISQGNHDIDTFIGAYNVLLSKIYYRYLKQTRGYYSVDGISYSGITQVSNPLNKIPIILIAPPISGSSAFYNKIKTIADGVKAVGALWSIPVISAFNETQYNPMINQDADVHQAIYYFDYVGGQILEKLSSYQRVFEKQYYKTTIHNIAVSNSTEYNVNVVSTAYEDDIVSLCIETSTSPTVSILCNEEPVGLNDLGLYGEAQYHYYTFKMPDGDVTISVSNN